MRSGSGYYLSREIMANRAVYPRPEYPRPDFQRGTIDGKDWLNLNGPWQFRFDGDKRGLDDQWFLPSDQDWREQIIVPFCWESLAAWGEAETAGNDNYYATRAYRNPLEVTRANHSYVARYEVGWYRKRIKIPSGPDWDGKRLILKIGAADFFTDCWCNGKHIGHHEGGYTPFEFDLTDAIGENRAEEILVVLRVEDPMDNREQPVGKQWHWYTPTSGIWQTVYLEPRNEAHIDCFRVFTDIDKKKVRLEFDTLHAPTTSEIEVTIIPPAGEVERHRTKVRENKGEIQIAIPHPYFWNPNDPHIYRTVYRLISQKQKQDEIHSYFGMRKIDSGPSDDPNAPALLRLNNVPRYLRGALYQSYFPDGVYTASDVEMIKSDIRWAKQFGFNFLRVHIKIDDPLLLYYADTMGIMLMADFPNFGEGGNTPTGRRRFEEMMRAAVKRDFNHPSIVAWCVFNETWGFGGQADFVELFPDLKKKIFDASTAAPEATPEAQAEKEKKIRQKMATEEAHKWVQSMWTLAKELDPTRLVEDMSVVHWEHMDYFAHGDTDINSWHFYIDDYEKAKEHIDKVVQSTYAGSTFNYVPGFQQRSQPLINSEYGGVGALDGIRDCSWSFKFLTNELRRHGPISAYIYTELHDVEWEFNGFLTYNRYPKEMGFDPKVINESDALPINAPPVSQHAPGSVVNVEVCSSHFSTVHKDKVFLRWALGGMDSLGKFHQDICKGVVPIEFPHRRVALAKKLDLEMPKFPGLFTLWLDAIDTTGVKITCNFIHFFVSAGELPRREDIPRVTVLRNYPHDWAHAQWSGVMSSKEDAKVQDRCFGDGHGFFEWHFPTDGLDLSKAYRIRVLCEASSRRVNTPQTSHDLHPTKLHMDLNDVPLVRQVLSNHPHDSRGVLSYLRKDGRGAYGFFIMEIAEGELLQQVLRNQSGGPLRLRMTVPPDELAIGGLTVYGTEAGRYPISLLLQIEW